MIGILAALLLGAPGPEQIVTFHNARVNATVRYRIAHDAKYDTGPAAVSPSIASGNVVIVAGSHTYRYDLAQLFDIANTRIVLSSGPTDGCGTAATFAQRGRYLAIEAIVVEKGCAPIVVLVDVTTGRVAQEAVFDEVRSKSRGTLAIVAVDNVVLDAAKFDVRENTLAPWRFDVVRATDANGSDRVFAFDAGDFQRNARLGGKPTTLPVGGDRMSLEREPAAHSTAVRYYASQLVVQSAAK